MHSTMNSVATSLAVESIPRLARQLAAHDLWIDDTGTLDWQQFGSAVETVRR